MQAAPYNQVLQELLNPGSLMRRHGGPSVILVRPDEWVPERAGVHRASGRPEASLHAAPGSPIHLPDGTPVTGLNPYETAYVYQEIFVDRAYMRHGITLEPGDCVVDIGANIGLFSLFVQHEAPGARVIAFEPSPPAFAALQRNVARFGHRVSVLPYGAGAEDTTALFTTYTKSSVFSGFHADASADRGAIRAVVRNVLEDASDLAGGEVEALTDELMVDRLESETHEVPVRSLSSVVRELGLARIDLLKIDAEKSEWAVLRGIEDADWDRISQVVLEIHDPHGDLQREIQTHLETRGFEVVVEEETLLRSSGLFNLYAVRPDRRRSPRSLVTASLGLRRTSTEFIAAVKAAAPALGGPLSIVCCPASPEIGVSPAAVAAVERELEENLRGLPGVSVTTSAEWLRTYPTPDLHDPQADRLGHIPYTPEGFAALGTTVARRILAAIRPASKVVVVDCDNTLWTGVAAEDGPAGVTLDEGRRALQAFLVDQHAAGRLILLCSKNEEDDVFRVFRERTDFPLRQEHLTAWRINWESKSENLAALARGLNLGLDSFVFIDDNPVECAEVRGRCPDVVVWQLPADTRDIPEFLRHLWPLDARSLTAEDRQRAAMYGQEIARSQSLQAAPSYEAFIATLGLVVRMAPLSDASISRAAQLTQRTNQFNFTTIRRSELDLQRLMAAHLEFLTVDVSDRFGDYGLVGVVAFNVVDRAMVVDTFLLSCRVLGKGVEHQVLAHLGRTAVERGLTHVRLSFVETARNRPARRFAESLEPFSSSEPDRTVLSWAASTAAAVAFRPADGLDGPDAGEVAESKTAPSRPDSSVPNIAAFLSRVPTDLRTAAQVVAACAVPIQPDARSHRAPRTARERLLAEIWMECLGVTALGVDENFYALGGDSIRAVQIVARARRRGLKLTPSDVMAAETIEALARVVSTDPEARADVDEPRGEPFDMLPFERSHVAGTAADPIEDAFPATPMQAMFHAQHVAGLDAGFEQWELVFQGVLDVDRFRAAWNDVVVRHPALRTSFVVVEGHLIQRVHQHADMVFEWLDWRGVSADDRAQRLDAHRAQDRRRRMDLATPPLMRATLVQLGDADWCLCWTFHHLIIDGWSWRVIFRELADIYAGGSTKEALLSVVAPPYRDYVRWLGAQNPSSADAFWAGTLSGVAEPTRLITGRAAAGQPRVWHGELDESRTRALQDMAQRHHVTLGAVVTAAWALIVSRLSGRSDVLVGVTMSGRPPEVPGIEQMVGTFVGNLPLRARCDRMAALGAFVETVGRSLVACAEHQSVPLDRIQAATRVPGRHRLFDSLLVFQNYAGTGQTEAIWPQSTGATLMSMRVPTRTGYPVTVVVEPGPSLAISLVVMADEIGGSELESWLNDLVSLLERMPSAAAEQLGELLGPPRVVAAPAPEDGRPRPDSAGFKTDLESKIAGVWTSVFGDSDFSADDNFFDIGGHSMLMVKVHEQLVAVLGRRVSIVELFQHPSIRGLARHLAGDEAASTRLQSAQTRANRQLTALTGAARGRRR